LQQLENKRSIQHNTENRKKLTPEMCKGKREIGKSLLKGNREHKSEKIKGYCIFLDFFGFCSFFLTRNQLCPELHTIFDEAPPEISIFPFWLQQAPV
jgi:hypothetical protein